ncbi:MAG: ABC transporter substrate-binding protein [Sporichthyaceae bacterium]
MTPAPLSDRRLSRRALLHGALGLGVAASGAPLLVACAGDSGTRLAATGERDPLAPLETTRIVLPQVLESSCVGASALAETFLRKEGFTDVVYRPMKISEVVAALGSGDADFGMGYAAALLGAVDTGGRLLIVGGMHVGCWQLFATGQIRSIRDLKGGTIAIPGPGPDFLFKAFLGATLSSVGIDLRRDVTLVDYAPNEAKRLLSEGRVDGLLAFPPKSLELASAKTGRVVVNSASDRPWSNYYCCVTAANADWRGRHPVAAQRALRAFLRAADTTAAHPHRAARALVEKRFTANEALAHQNLRELPHDVWRTYDPADTIRFYALRMKEAGLVESTPQQLLDRGCDFAGFQALAREL